MYSIGLDIGTTSICAVVIDANTGAVLETRTAPNNTKIPAEPWASLQDPAKILAISRELVDFLTQKYGEVDGVGISGQMHGILYLGQDGEAESPLYTWQDGRGNLEHTGGQNYAERLAEITGYTLATGYGAATHYYNCANGLVPENAKTFCTISDYVGMRLAGESSPLLHISNAASLGLFDLRRGGFDDGAIEKSGMDFPLFPRITADFAVVGKTCRGVPVTTAIGDNQASFIGSVADMDSSVLVNVGTGSQISFLIQNPGQGGGMETRPLTGNSFILVGSSLCGGRAYAAVEEFFRGVVTAAGFEAQNLYPVLDKLAGDFTELANPLEVGTQFCGTRENAIMRGYVKNLGLDNFTPRHLATGVLWGIVDELYQKFAAVAGARQKVPATLIGSGNGIRKNAAMQKMFSQRFGMQMRIPHHKEEAAFGAALTALVGVGRYESISDAQKIIRYQEN